MKVAVTGATGNIGTRVVRQLAAEPSVDEVLAIARREPVWDPAPTVRFVAADVGVDALDPWFAGADAVIHLAWQIQPSKLEWAMNRTNVVGSARVLDAAQRSGVRALVHASSIGVYSPGPKQPMAEDWVRRGVPASTYSSHKVQVEDLLDAAEERGVPLRIARLRPTLVLTPTAASGIRRLFLGRLDPSGLVPADWLRVAFEHGPVRFQAVDGDDVARAFVAAALDDTATGAYNLATDDPIGNDRRTLAALARPAVWALWQSGLLAADPGWLELVRSLPLVSSKRARSELGWEPEVSGHEVLDRFLHALRERRSFPTPPLARSGAGA